MQEASQHRTFPDGCFPLPEPRFMKASDLLTPHSFWRMKPGVFAFHFPKIWLPGTKQSCLGHETILFGSRNNIVPGTFCLFFENKMYSFLKSKSFFGHFVCNHSRFISRLSDSWKGRVSWKDLFPHFRQAEERDSCLFENPASATDTEKHPRKKKLTIVCPKRNKQIPLRT